MKRMTFDELDDELRQCLQIILTNAALIADTSPSHKRREALTIVRAVRRAVDALRKFRYGRLP